ncbi:MAG: 2-dehydropantoate 2-reductase [Lentisphaeraceae bacterium]|nr:2-dehydropantoate 2-reductase [Lentisphaeraceae bacterium]
MNSVAIIGTGAIGGYYGAKLLNAGYDVHFLVNSDYEHILANGLKVDSPDGNMVFQKVNVWNKPVDLSKCDLVIVTLKTTSNHLLSSILPHCCYKESKVLVLQNGLGTDKDSADAVPQNEIFGGVCSIAANKIGPGYIKHIGYNEIRMGQYLRNGEAAGVTENLLKISNFLNSAGISTVLSENITEARWRKLVWNMAFNGLTTVLNCDTKVIMNDSEHRKRAISIMNEVISAAGSCGIHIKKEFTSQMVKLTDEMAPYLPSMKLDFENHRPLELEVIYRRPIEQAKINKCDIPEIEKLYDDLLELTRR